MEHNQQMLRQPEPELMDDASEASAYAGADFSQVNQAFVDHLLQLAGDMGLTLASRASVLDLGTGPADIPIRVAHAQPHWTITAVDAAPAMLELADKAIHAAHVQHSIRLLHANAKSLPLADAAFDIIFSNSILHHVADPDAFWREVRRLAKPGALIFLRDLARPASLEQARQIVRQHAGTQSALLQQEYFRSLLAAYTVPEVAAQLVNAHLPGLDVRMSTGRHLDVWGRVACDASASS
jgi:ubiquinone/menaquinone biosynthesis C-methylase UbiE